MVTHSPSLPLHCLSPYYLKNDKVRVRVRNLVHIMIHSFLYLELWNNVSDTTVWGETNDRRISVFFFFSRRFRATQCNVDLYHLDSMPRQGEVIHFKYLKGKR